MVSVTAQLFRDTLVVARYAWAAGLSTRASSRQHGSHAHDHHDAHDTGNPLQYKFEQLCRDSVDGNLPTSTVSNYFLSLEKEGARRAAHVASDGSAASSGTTRSQTQAVTTRVKRAPACTPYSLETALQPSDDARVITECDAPFRIYHVNPAWERLCGWKLNEVLGKPGFTFMQGDVSSSSQMQYIRHNVAAQGFASLDDLTSFRRDGAPFVHTLTVSPLLGPSGTSTHLLGVLKRR